MTAIKITPLTLDDFCDRCGSRAYVFVKLKSGRRLSFCGHHAREHDEALRQQASEMVDETARLAEDAATR